MKRLFNDNAGETYNEHGSDLDREIRHALKPIFDKYAAEGFSVRDIEDIVIAASSLQGASMRIMAGMKAHKAKKAREGET